MTAKEQLKLIIDQLTEEQLVGFILLFGKYYPEAISPEEYEKYAKYARMADDDK